MDSLGGFSEGTRGWFERTFDAPTPAQVKGWPVIASGAHTLIQAPTGSGKTLAAFLYAIDRLTPTPGEGLRVLYVSPLKALNYDVERNLRGPLAGLQSQLRVAVRTGDTSQKERAAMLREAPDILITTPESLYLMLTSQARGLLRSGDTVILDEGHAGAGTKRGAHMALSLERLERLVGDASFQRIGLSATQRPLEEIGRFVSGARPIELVDAGVAKRLDVEGVVPVEDMRELAQTGTQAPDGERPVNSIWPSIYPALLELVRAHRSTIVFVNNRRLAERLGQRSHQLAERRLELGRGCGRRPGHHEHRPGLVGGEPGEVGASPADQRPAAVAAGLGIHRDPRRGQRLEVAAGSALGDFELLGQLGSGQPPAGLQQQQRCHQPVRLHGDNFS